MKKTLLLVVFSLIGAKSFSQAATALKFDQRYTQCEKKWVVLSKADTAKSYTYGYIYIDEQAGFTFDLQGVFKINDNGRYIKDTVMFNKTGSMKYRITPNWRPVALLPSTHLKELKLPFEPDWVKLYYNTKDPAYHNYRMGWIYNDVNESKAALIFLNKAYALNPHKPGVEFEMAYAYNVLNKCDSAIKILKPALQYKPDDALLYKELAYAYNKLNNYDKAIEAYRKGLSYFPSQQSDSKGEMAFNMANIYKKKGNQDEYKNWMLKAKEYVAPTSYYYKQITSAGF